MSKTHTHLSDGSAEPFSLRLISWQKRAGRHGLPWKKTRDPYRIWLSEIMLQQTQVATVIPYYLRFLEKFPTVDALASAPLDDILQLWAGLGYYARARNLHRCAQQVLSALGGVFPTQADVLITLPGIGRSTAAAIAVFSSGERAAILDGNVKRVLCRHFGIEGAPTDKAVEAHLWACAVAALPDAEIEAYTQGLMDLGATVCTRTRPACEGCCVRQTCVAAQTGRVAELPTPKARKARAQRSIHMLLLQSSGRIFLQQRPATGIWGGLWSLPEEPVPPAVEHLAQRWHSPVSTCRALPAMVHDFTHFRLHIQPWLVHLEKIPNSVAQARGAWLRPDEIAHYGCPKPVTQLLAAWQNTVFEN